ncbi:MAG: choice-of-anchor Q domain-containing protein [Cyanobacteria bacterium P01_D01_bin.123]
MQVSGTLTTQQNDNGVSVSPEIPPVAIASSEISETPVGSQASDSLVVNTLVDENDGIEDGEISLREALAAISEGGTITFDSSLQNQTIVLAGSELQVERSLTIAGDTRNVTIDANLQSRVFNIDDGDAGVLSQVGIDGLTLTRGLVSVFDEVDASGGGIRNAESLALSRSSVFNNNASSAGGIANLRGASLTLVSSTLSGNSSTFSGGGINNLGSLEIVNSTLSGNSSSTAGGGISAASNTVTEIRNSTLVGNTANAGGGIQSFAGSSVIVSSSLISGNTATSNGNEIYNSGSLTANSQNLFGHGGQSNAQAFVGFSPEVSDINATSDGIDNALTDILDTNLAANGGPTQTHALVRDSPAIDTGNNDENLNTDQRGEGFVRVDGVQADIGAFEATPPPAELIVNTLADENDGIEDGEISLREALAAIADGGIITFDSSLQGQTITLGGSQLDIVRSVTIDGDVDGDEVADITVDANQQSRVFDINDGDGNVSSEVILSRLIISGGSVDGGRSGSASGGGILNRESLTLSQSTLSGNSARDIGGGIFSSYGTATITQSTLSGNSASSGGGIFNLVGTATIIQSTLSGNMAVNNGGGVSNFGTATIIQSTLSGNTTQYQNGGGLENYGIATISQSTISGNTSPELGGGIFNSYGTATISQSTLSGNSAFAGGGIFNNSSTLAISQSTLSGNLASNNGGGVSNGEQSTTTISQSTLFGNRAGVRGAGISNLDVSTTTLNNSILSDNVGQLNGVSIFNEFPAIINANANNLFGHSEQSNADAFFNFTPGASDINATSDGINVALVDILDPVLRDNGGPTLTHALIPGSPALDAGNNAAPLDLNEPQLGIDLNADGDTDDTLTQIDQLPFDQRGPNVSRISNGTVDIGSIELQVNIPNPIVGTEARDRLYGTDADDIIEGLGNNDALRGFGGNDTILGGNGNDQIFGDIPNTFGIGGNDFIDAGAGNDSARGNGGNDTILGGAGLDRLFGGEGDDILRGGLGNDVLQGDSRRSNLSNDTFVLAAGEGTDTIKDFQVGEDTIGLADGLSFGSLTLTDLGNSTEIAFGTEVLAVLNRVSAQTLDANSFVSV